MAKTFVERLNDIVGLWEYEEEVKEQGSRQPSLKKIQLVEITALDDAERLLRFLRTQEPVIMDMEKLNNEDKQGVMDFICGMAYAMDGTIERIRDGIFVLAPYGMEIDDDSVWYSMYR